MVFFLKIKKCSRRVRDRFSYLYNRGFHHTTLLLPPCISSCWNVLFNRSGREMVEDVIKVLDHIMKCWTTWWTCSANSQFTALIYVKLCKWGEAAYPVWQCCQTRTVSNFEHLEGFERRHFLWQWCHQFRAIPHVESLESGNMLKQLLWERYTGCIIYVAKRQKTSMKKKKQRQTLSAIVPHLGLSREIGA